MGLNVAISRLPYVPLLKGKEGEFKALKNLSPEMKASLIPFIDIPANPRDHESKSKKLSLEYFIARRVKKLSAAWNRESPLYIDLFHVDSTERTTSGLHGLHQLRESADSEGLKPIFVTGLERDIDYQNAFQSVIIQKDQPVCIRLESEDMELGSGLLDKTNKLLKFFRLDPEQVHLLMDFASLVPDETQKVKLLALQTHKILSLLGKFPKVILAGSAFPETLSSVKNNGLSKVVRHEFLIWKEVSREWDSDCELVYGDYGIQHPNLPDIDPRTMSASGNIRYTIADHFLIVKGYSLKKEEKYGQFNSLAKKLILMQEYYGNSFSWGDSYIFECANNKEGPGNLATWRAVGTSHHLAVVAESLRMKHVTL